MSTYENYPSVEPYSILCQLYLSVGQIYLISEQQAQLVNNQISSIPVDFYSFSNPILVEVSSLAMSVTPATSSFDTLVIAFPSEFVFTVESCTLPSGVVSALDLASNSYTLTSTTGSWVTPISFTIKDFTTPRYTPSSPITVETYSERGYLMGRDGSMVFETECTLPCRTCSGSTCTSCYSDPTLVSSRVILSGDECVSACSNGFYQDSSTGECEQCSSLCELCLDYSVCTACPVSFYLHEDTCLDSCPFGYY